jgi:hypothetical protein
LTSLAKSIDHRWKQFRKHPSEDHTSYEANDDICDHTEHCEARAAGKATGLSEGKRKSKRDTKIATRWLCDVIAVHVRRDKGADTKNESDNQGFPTQVKSYPPLKIATPFESRAFG